MTTTLGQATAAEPGRTPWVPIGAGGLAVLLTGAIVLMFLRRKRSWRGEAS